MTRSTNRDLCPAEMKFISRTRCRTSNVSRVARQSGSGVKRIPLENYINVNRNLWVYTRARKAANELAKSETVSSRGSPFSRTIRGALHCR